MLATVAARRVPPAWVAQTCEQRTGRWVSDVLDTGEPAHSTTDLHPWYVTAGQYEPDATMAVGLQVPECMQFYREHGNRQEQGSPLVEQWLVTVDTDGQRVELA